MAAVHSIAADARVDVSFLHPLRCFAVRVEVAPIVLLILQLAMYSVSCYKFSSLFMCVWGGREWATRNDERGARESMVVRQTAGSLYNQHRFPGTRRLSS